MSYPLVLPPGRGGIQPLLALHYSNNGGPSAVGVGWSLGLPSIERRGLAGGPPRFDSTDSYYLSGSRLVQLCVVAGTTCTTSQGATPMPHWAAGWTLFRPAVDASYVRAFKASDGLTWRVQQRSGEIWEMGVPTGTGGSSPDPLGGIDYSNATLPFRWKLIRQFEAFASGSQPKNIIRYSWRHQQTAVAPFDISRLTDIYYTPPAAGWANDADFAHHIHLAYEASLSERTRRKFVDVPAWLREPEHVVTRIDIASKQLDSAREQVRRYHLTYDYMPHVVDRPYLTRIVLEGRCAPNALETPQEDDGHFTVWALPTSTGCPRYEPGTIYTYTHGGTSYSGADPFDPDGTYLRGFPQRMSFNAGGSPAPSPALSPRYMALMDVDRDGRADVLANPGRVFLNSRDAFVTGTQFDMAGLVNWPYYGWSWVATEGISVPGTWSDRWGASWIHRFAPPTSAGDGSPDHFFVVRKASAGPGWEVADHSGQFALSPLPRPHLYGDLDGDGTIDYLYLDETGASPPPTKVRFSRRAVDGPPGAVARVRPFTELPPVGPYPAQTNLKLRTGLYAPRAAALADMNGDGIPDYVTTRDPQSPAGEWVYIPGRGDGRFGCTEPGAECTTAIASPGFDESSPLTSLTEVSLTGSMPSSPGGGGPVPAFLPPPDGSTETERRVLPHVAFHDVTGDGKADLVSVSKVPESNDITLDVWINLNGRELRRSRTVLSSAVYSLFVNAPSDPLADETRLLFGDIDGDGIDDVVLCGDDECMFRRYQDDKPGLLSAIQHEGGATTTFEYFKGLADVEASQALSNPWPEEGAWRSHAPSPIWPIKRITTSNNAPGWYSRTTTQDFDYRDPVYDRWRTSFRGFRRMRASAHGLVVDTQYLFGGCLLDDAAAQLAGGCEDPEKGAGWEPLNGQPAVIERWDGVSVYHSTTANKYGLQTSDEGVSFSYVSEVHTYLYDTSSFVPSPSSETFWTPLQTPYDVPIRASAIHLRRRQDLDTAANMIAAHDDGRVDSAGAAIDRPISTTFEWKPTDVSWPAAVSALGRQYRLKSAETKYGAGGAGSLLTAASGLDGPPRKLTHGYDALGRLATTSSTISGTVLLERFHKDGFPIASEPVGAVEGWVQQLSSLSYDAFGNVSTRRGAAPNYGTPAECQTVEYDTAFADHPKAVHVWLGANCTGADLTTTMQYDRGLGIVIQHGALNGETQRVDTDAFGRPSATWGPAPAGGLQLETTFIYSSSDQPVHWVHAVREAVNPANKGASRAFTDSVGRPIVTLTQADPSAGDGGDWVAHTAPLLSPRGEPIAWHRPAFHQGGPETFSVGYSFGQEDATATYDFMSRRLTAWRSADGHQTERREYRPLEVDVWDGEGMAASSPHFGMFTSTSRDGHGRVVRTLQSSEAGPVYTFSDYLATGELAAIERTPASLPSAPGRYRRWLKYDSLGHVVENAEPNSATGFADLPGSAPQLKAWRYRYDGAGRLVGTRDARGCGKNIYYDLANRVIAEDFSPCLKSQQAYSGPPDLGTGDKTEVFNRYDSPEPGQTSDYGNPLYLKGKLISIRDRGAHTRLAYDARGRRTGIARRIAKPGDTSELLASRYTDHWFRAASHFDERDRLERLETGADVSDLQEAGESYLDYHYSARNVVSSIDGSYGVLLQSQRFAADGAPELKRFGDALQTEASFTYRADRRLENYTLHQAGAQPLDLINQTFGYDEVGNITSIADGRDAERWPQGAQPVSRTISHDALYRVTSVTYSHQGDQQVSPFQAEENASNALPLPRVVFGGRVGSQTFEYDVHGNVTAAHEDTHSSSFDRGFGTATMGDLDAPDEASRKPNQLRSALGAVPPPPAAPEPSGAVEAHYDAAGNLVDLALERDGTCSLPTGKCAQRFEYQWDEVGQLTRAARWDYATLAGEALYPTAPAGPAAAELRYQYSQGQRVIKESIDPSSGPTYAVEIFGTLRLNHATYSAGSNDFERTSATETVYLPGLGRVIFQPGLPSAGSDRHVFLNFGDHLGSATVVVDKDTGQLVEYATYQAYGALDSDYRPTAWQSFREDFKFTGKEEDTEVGIQYFGARYYSPYLARFISPDPLTVHAMGSDLNPYAYVGGRVFNATDPTGLEGTNPPPKSDSSGGSPGGAPSNGGGDDGPPRTVECEVGDGGCFSGGYGSGSSGSTSLPPPPPKPGWVASGWQAVSNIRVDVGRWHVTTGNVWKATANQLGDAALFHVRLMTGNAADTVAPVPKFQVAPDGPGDVSEHMPTAASLVSAAATGGPALVRLTRMGIARLTGQAAVAIAETAVEGGVAAESAMAAEGATAAEAGAGASAPSTPGLAELPADVAVPIRAGEPIAIPRALTPSEMAALTNTTGNIEFSQTFANGQHWLTRADFATPNRVLVLPWQPGETQWISHSHPAGYSGMPSGVDRGILQQLGQAASRVVRPNGSSVRFGP